MVTHKTDLSGWFCLSFSSLCSVHICYNMSAIKYWDQQVYSNCFRVSCTTSIPDWKLLPALDSSRIGRGVRAHPLGIRKSNHNDKNHVVYVKGYKRKRKNKQTPHDWVRFWDPNPGLLCCKAAALIAEPSGYSYNNPWVQASKATRTQSCLRQHKEATELCV